MPRLSLTYPLPHPKSSHVVHCSDRLFKSVHEMAARRDESPKQQHQPQCAYLAGCTAKIKPRKPGIAVSGFSAENASTGFGAIICKYVAHSLLHPPSLDPQLFRCPSPLRIFTGVHPPQLIFSRVVHMGIPFGPATEPTLPLPLSRDKGKSAGLVAISGGVLPGAPAKFSRMAAVFTPSTHTNATSVCG